MWPKNFGFFREFIDDLKTLFLFNTIKNKPEGLTYYDLKQYGSIPHSKIYRMMKKLEEEGDLVRKDDFSKDTGRPKHLYSLSEQGKIKLRDLKIKLGEFFEFLKYRFPTTNTDFDHESFLQEATFKVWASPIEHIMRQEVSNEGKLKALSKMESRLTEYLKKVQTTRNKLEKMIQNSK